MASLSLSHPCFSLKSAAVSLMILFIFPVYASFTSTKALISVVRESFKLVNERLSILNA
jgi:hypothetical protein